MRQGVVYLNKERVGIITELSWIGILKIQFSALTIWMLRTILTTMEDLLFLTPNHFHSSMQPLNA